MGSQRRMMRGVAARFVALCGCAALRAHGATVDPMRHDIFSVTGANFDNQINSHRKHGVATVLFYDDSPRSQALIDGEYNKFASAARGMVKAAAVDCEQWGSFCKKHVASAAALPAVLVFPPQPFPSFAVEGEVTEAALRSSALRLIPSDHVRQLAGDDKATVEAFLATQVAVPKVLLFSNKEKPPVMYNALANAFHDRMTFGFVPEQKTELVKRFNVTKFPTLLILKGENAASKGGEVYDGEMKFLDMHEWLNVRSETFVKGGGFASEESVEEVKPWLVQKIPEVTRASHQDVCFRHQGLCMMYITPGGAPSEETIKMLEDLAEKYEKLPGPKFIFSWVDGAVETDFAKLVDFEGPKPTVVAFKPKRPRYTKIEPETAATSDAIDALIEKISGGDAKFVQVKGKLPSFALREAPKDNKDEL